MENNNELDIAKQRLLYLSAEFENYKKRVDRDKASWAINAQINILEKIVPILDDFERLIKELKDNGFEEKEPARYAGILMVEKSFKKVLSDLQVEEIKDHETFDPEIHEAIIQEEVAEKESGLIINIFEKGFKYKGHVLRPSKVSVSK